MDNHSALSFVSAASAFARYSVPHWTASLIGLATVIGLTLLSNLLIFVHFICVPSRVTPFTMYHLILLLCNVFFLLVVPLPVLINELYGYWWMGRWCCNFHNYSNQIISSCQIWIHVTMSINRLWAVHIPIFYKNHHNRRTALLTCLAAVVLAHIIGLPGCIVDAMYYAIDLDHGCHINYGKQLLWGHMQQALLHMLPLLFIITAYVDLCINRVKRRKPGNHATVGLRKIRAARVEDNAVAGLGEQTAAVNNKSNHNKTKEDAIKPLLVLSLTAISVTICWTPVFIYFAASIFFGLQLSVTYFTVAVTFYSLQALFDPLLFALSLLTGDRNLDLFRCGC